MPSNYRRSSYPLGKSLLASGKGLLMALSTLLIVAPQVSAQSTQTADRYYRPTSLNGYLAQAPLEDPPLAPDFRQRRDRRANTMMNPALSPRGGMSDRIKRYMNDGDDGGNMSRKQMRMQRIMRRIPEDMRRQLEQMPPSERRRAVRQMMKRRFQRDGRPGGRGFNRGAEGLQGRAQMERMPVDAAPPGGVSEIRGFRQGMPPPQARRRGRQGRQGHRNKMRGGRQWFGRKPIDFSVLGLSDKQKTRIQTMRSRNAERARQIQQRLKRQRKLVRDKMFDPNATPEQLHKMHRDLSSLQNQAGRVMLDDFLGIRSVLTKEQLQRLPEIKPWRRRAAKQARPRPNPGL